MKRTIYLIFSFCLIITFTSCKKGCNDATAANYDDKAKKNDGSCYYEAKISFWFSEGKSLSFIDGYGIESLSVFLDESQAGTIDPANWSVGPDCDGANFTVTHNMGVDKEKNVNYMVNDQTGFTRYEGIISLIAGDCINIQLD